ncbi:apelin receptor-like [Dendronephthya gigantea]|uniref:apelin receptor-like n=1 Tax=Dendronephthya gigantea TaxID=151771 RepID=UPI00106CC074|nr:apelin receptor-like [Dendronephthya gigantea]
MFGRAVCPHIFLLAAVQILLPVHSSLQYDGVGRNASNGTSPEDPQDIFETVLYTSLIVSVCGVISNGFLLVVFAMDPLRCLRNVSSGLILNLCIADLLTSTTLVLWNTNTWDWASDELSEVIFSLVWFGYSASFLTVALLSLERYIVIRYIWSSDSVVTKRRTAYAVVIIWLISGMSFVRLDKKNISVHIFISSSVYELCVLVVIVFYTKLWVIRRRHTFQHHRALKKESELTKVVFALIILLFVTTLPLIFLYQLLHGLNLFCGTRCIPNDMVYIPPYLTPIFSVNFVINPALYGWRLPKYRRSFFAVCGVVVGNPVRQKIDKVVRYTRKETNSLEVNTTQVTNGSCISL